MTFANYKKLVHKSNRLESQSALNHPIELSIQEDDSTNRPRLVLQKESQPDLNLASQRRQS